MAIRFDERKFARVKAHFEGWWNGGNSVPVAGATIRRHAGGAHTPRAPYPAQNNVSLDVPVDDLLDAVEYELSQYEYRGDAFPFVNLDCFGPGVLAAFLGAKPDNRTGRIWFSSHPVVPAQKLHFTYDPETPWLVYIRRLLARGAERFNGLVCFSMPDLGGVLDVLSTFLPGERLLLLLYDDPDSVLRLCKELTEVWHRCYEDLAAAGRFSEIGYTDWSGIWSASPSYVLQCDFSYMIGPEMFRRFALPGLHKSCRRLSRSIYHLDGVGELPHLESLLSIPELDAVQWVPGTGQKPVDEWPEVYCRIAAAGKRIQVLCHGFHRLERIMEAVASPGSILYQYHAAPLAAEQEASALRALERLGVEV